VVESANKGVVQARLEGSGMQWKQENFNAMLALQTAECNDRWDEAWNQDREQYRQKHTRSRVLQQQKRV